MFRFDPVLNFYLHCEAIDFRFGLNGLAVLAEQVLGMNSFCSATSIL